MELKKFEAPTLAEALQVVKRELGPEAVIISTRNNKGGFGLLNKASVEVTAAVSEEALEKKRVAEQRMPPEQLARLRAKPAQKVVQAYDVLSGSRLERKMNQQAVFAGKTASTGTPNQITKKEINTAANLGRITQRRYVDIQDDDSPAELASAYTQDSPRIQTPSPSPLAQALQAQSFQKSQNRGSQILATRQPSQAQSSNNPILPKLLADLIESGVEPELVRELGDELKIVMVKEQINKIDLARHQLARILMSRLRVARPLGERLRLPNTPRMISFVGPTGVGKTTTIAKIAAELVIHQRRPVTLVTTDTYKIAAVEQLQTYANILKIPLEVCPTAEALDNLAASLDPETVILIDTAGFGPKDDKKLEELRDALAGVKTETHLCVSALTRDRDLAEIVRRFRIFNPDYLVITKIDETTSFGGIYNIGSRSQIPLSYFTMGQRVPEDMEVATKERVADLLLNISGGGTV